MEILTLLRANIRRKKSTFISIAILMIIITTVSISIFSVRDNYKNGMETAFQTADCGDTTVIMKTKDLTDELRSAVENSSLVDHIDYFEALCGNGIAYGEINNGNSIFLTLMRRGIKLYNSNLDEFENKIPELSAGEIYLPLGLKANIECDVGDKVSVAMISGISEDFIVKGFVQEPIMGSFTIGWKQVFISREDYDRIYDQCEPLVISEDMCLEMTILSVHQSEESSLTPVKFQRELNLETKLVDKSIGALNKETSIRYSTLMPDIIMDIVMAFMIFLFLIVLIVMNHSIGTEIETDYIMLGILKSQGFGNGKLRLIFFFQYMAAQLLGIVIGIIAAIPVKKLIGSVFQSITAVLPDSGFSLANSVLYTSLILGCSALIIIIKTHKLTKISPIRAISGGREEIYFDSRLNVPISPKGLSAALALRQFTSNKKRYMGTIVIASILTFFMITVNLIGVLLSSRSALSAIGLAASDIELSYAQIPERDYIDEAEKLIEQRTKVTEKNRITSIYCSLNGENLHCEVYKYPQYILGILKGREPKYDNELMITKMVGEALDLKIGDKVTLSHGDKEEEFLISGIYQSTSDSGMTFSINFDGAETLGIKTEYAYEYFVLEDKSAVDDIIKELTEKYGDVLEIYKYDEENNPVMGQFYDTVNILKIIIYFFSILFAFVVVRMVCVKTFVQERKDIGIFKALGFTSNKLRFSFAIRFMIAALIGTVTGAVLSILFSAKLLSIILSLIGVTNVVLEFTAVSMLLPIAVICLSFFVFSYFASKGIRRVEVRELVSE